MRVIQLLPTLAYGDAIGNDVLAIQDMIRKWGFETGIWAEHVVRLPEGTAKPLDTLPALWEDDVIIYHASIDSKWADMLPAMRGKKVLIYHNITPSYFFHGMDDFAEKGCQRGLEQMKNLARSETIHYCIADSEFNKQDLLSLGFTCPIDVCPILIPFQDYRLSIF